MSRLILCMVKLSEQFSYFLLTIKQNRLYRADFAANLLYAYITELLAFKSHSQSRFSSLIHMFDKSVKTRIVK